MKAPGDGTHDLERLLERDLDRSAGRLRAPSPSPSQSAYHRFAAQSRSTRIRARLRVAWARAGVSLVAAGLVASGGAVVATAATGSTNPGVWGTTITRTVAPPTPEAPAQGHASHTAGKATATATPAPLPAAAAPTPAPAPTTGTGIGHGSPGGVGPRVRPLPPNGKPPARPGTSQTPPTRPQPVGASGHAARTPGVGPGSPRPVPTAPAKTPPTPTPTPVATSPTPSPTPTPQQQPPSPSPWWPWPSLPPVPIVQGGPQTPPVTLPGTPTPSPTPTSTASG